MNDRPRLKPKLTAADKVLELLGWLLLTAMWVVTLFYYDKLPDTIVTHYNLSGKADGFGNKINLIALPTVATIMNFAMTVLNRFPHIFNYPVSITQENALKQYTIATRLIRWLKLAVVLIFGTLCLLTIGNAIGENEDLPAWFTVIALCIVIIPLVYFVFLMLQDKNNRKQLQN